jgi:hypothetical protein
MKKTKPPFNPAAADYEIGFGKPPEHTRYKPGESGRRRGRSKGSRNFKTDVNETLKTAVKVTRNGKLQNISTQKAMLMRLREKALTGDTRAIDRLVQLAQTYNNEEAPVVGSVAAGDEYLLQIYQERVLSGAAQRCIPIAVKDHDA